MSGDTQTERVKVFCRIKPNCDGGEECISYLDETSLSIQNIRGKSSKSIHAFSRVFTSSGSQSEIFGACLFPYVKCALNGENALFFNYGVTGSGKTYTMQGTMSDPGLIPRTLDTIFNSIASNSTLKYVVKSDGHNGFDLQTEAEAIMDRQRFDYSSRPRTPYKSDFPLSCLEGRVVDSTVVSLSRNYLYAVFITYIELYNDTIYDLLEVSTGGCGRPLTLYEDVNRNVYVHGITELEVKSANEALKAYYQGQKRRRVGATALNKESSRSHGIFTIRVVRTGYDSTYDEVIMDKSLLSINQLCLVDLAGSERTNRSGTTGGRLKEAATINKSLLTLRKCVEVLRMNQSARECQNPTVQQQIVPYRDCKLTRLFKSFFDGCGQVAILVCVHPTLSEYSETVHVLQFAEHSQQVSTTIPTTPAKIDYNSTRDSRKSSALLVSNEEIMAAISSIRALDTSLVDSVSVITSSSADIFPLNFCGCFAESGEGRRNSSKRARRSSSRISWHSSKCPLFSVLQARFNERDRIRGLLARFSAEIESHVSDAVHRAESRDPCLALRDTLDKLSVEKLQIELRNRYLENEVIKQKALVSFERTERMREMGGLKAQANKLKAQLDALRTSRTLLRSKWDCHGFPSVASSISSDSNIDENTSLKRRPKKAVAAPASMSRVAALSHQWETRLAAERQRQEVGMGLRSKTPIPRFHTEVTLDDVLNRPPAMNPRHRRSRSIGGDHSVWLEHKESRPAPLGTIFSPTGVNVRKSVTRIELDDTLQATNYVLHHQTATPEGNVETKLFKGAIIPTAGGGSAIVFNDVEELRQVSPLSTNLRQSTRLSRDHELSVTEADTKDNDDRPQKRQQEWHPVGNRRSTRAHRLSLISTTSGVSSANVKTEEDEKSQISYRTVTPPSNSEYPGLASTEGISGVYNRAI
ncbi:Kinesin-like protein KIF23 [Echinococcus granulosus]|uniref:Kinesin-like protein KIF23 n=1 Tax=Echinococcus granulosus TaxID=6210 RepID=W6V718_ECHGR|nr:Kinesin-like protein KIF23 [Echinococcus granulosus]EUB62219.1 Kinesin-like protein KIF23 [Echinococcus granulosus]